MTHDENLKKCFAGLEASDEQEHQKLLRLLFNCPKSVQGAMVKSFIKTDWVDEIYIYCPFDKEFEILKSHLDELTGFIESNFFSEPVTVRILSGIPENCSST